MTFMHDAQETFFTSIGCMDGRVQEPIAEYGLQNFDAIYPDTITDAGFVAILANSKTGDEYFESIKKKLLISVEKHKSLGIVVHGHQKCAGNPVDDEEHKKDILKAAEKVREMLDERVVMVIPAFVKLYPTAIEVLS